MCVHACSFAFACMRFSLCLSALFAKWILPYYMHEYSIFVQSYRPVDQSTLHAHRSHRHWVANSSAHKTFVWRFFFIFIFSFVIFSFTWARHHHIPHMHIEIFCVVVQLYWFVWICLLRFSPLSDGSCITQFKVALYCIISSQKQQAYSLTSTQGERGRESMIYIYACVRSHEYDLQIELECSMCLSVWAWLDDKNKIRVNIVIVWAPCTIHSILYISSFYFELK